MRNPDWMVASGKFADAGLIAVRVIVTGKITQVFLVPRHHVRDRDNTLVLTHAVDAVH